MNITKSMLLASLLAAPALHAEDGDWKSIGTGIYCEDLATYFNLYAPFIDEGLKWNVEIEESTTTPGYYRFQPYCDQTPMAEAMGYADDTYMYIHAEDPEKVWMVDGEFYDSYLIYSHCVAETGWDENPDNLRDYGTLTDGCISFPAKCIAVVNIYDDDYGWAYTNINGDFKVYLPGNATVDDDYSIYVDYSYCAPGDEVPVTITVGSAVASVKYLLEPGSPLNEEGELDLDMHRVATQGTVTPDGECKFKCPARGVYTLSFVTLDADGNAQKGKAVNIYGVVDDDSAWKSLGLTTYHEALIADHYEMDECDLEVEIQESVATPGFYRLVNPYAEYEYNMIESHDDHNHYIYIHAEDPECVYIENTPIGADFGFGEGHVTSSVAKALEQGFTLDEIKATGTEHGYLKDGVISFPDYGLWYGDKDYFDGYFYSKGNHTTIAVPQPSGVENVIATETAPAEYYNLQGIRLEHKPAKGLYIEKTGTDARLKL
ncbi:MAG: hypothetical protein K2I64_06140 [Muribaculaceae bacterium]|nr:hypothetical protein [Muribaculaceae bacterium]